MTEGTEDKADRDARLASTGRRANRVAVIVLAAGSSSRFGSPKQGALVQGMPLAERALRVALECGADKVLLVTGAHAVTTLYALKGMRAEDMSRVQIVNNADWATGQASSVRTAVRSFDSKTGAAIFMPVDQPFLHTDLLRQLIAEWRGGASIVAPSVNGELRGAPALFDRVWFDELAALEGDKGGRVLLQRHAMKVHAIEVSDVSSLLDIDTPADLPTEGR